MSDVEIEVNAPIEPPQTLCVNCGNFPAGQIKLSSSASFLVFWRRRYLKENLCPVCAEGMYFQSQKTNGRFGWWGPISFVYALFSIFRNISQIKAHRKAFPWVNVEGERFARPILQIRSDAPTVIVSTLLLAAIVFLSSTFFSTNQFLSSYRNENGEVTRPYTAVWDEVELGDCFNEPYTVPAETKDPEEEKISEPISQVDLIPCNEPHEHQLYRIGALGPNSYSEAEYDEIVLNACADEVWLRTLDLEKLSALSDPDTDVYIPITEEARRASHKYRCVVFNRSGLLNESMIK